MKKSIDYTIIPNFEDCHPRITLIISDDFRRKKKKELNNCLANEANKIEKDLLKKYSREKAAPIMKKLRSLIEENFSGSNGKTIGIFVSPCSEELYYFTATKPAEVKLPPVLVPGNMFVPNF